MSATNAHARTAADVLDKEIAGREGRAADCGADAISVAVTGADVFGLTREAGRPSRFPLPASSTGASAVAGAVTAGRCSVIVPAGRRSSLDCTLAVTMPPSIADFHR